MNSILDDILPLVRKPGRYLGNEWNSAHKDFSSQELRLALCFPDLYEIGMSNLGLRIIYGLLNSQEGVSCERVFMPDIDMRDMLRSKGLGLFSLESRRPLKEFELLGFSLSYELCYTNVLAVLELSDIPLLAVDRPRGFPLVIAGGPCAVNPEPLADFVDLFLIGEAEEAILEIVEVYKKARNKDKEGLLRELSRVEGVYVPSFYSVDYDSDGYVKSFSPKYPDTPRRIRKRIVKNLDAAYYPASQWLVPYIQTVHDRAAIELMRGCPHSCSFCQARGIYGGLRLRSPDKVKELARQALESSGYEEISFLSLSSSNYPYLQQVISGLSPELEDKAVAVSLPSLRPKSYLGDLAGYLSKVRKTTLTFAPEAGSQRMRERINKNFLMEEFYSALAAVYKAGWQAVKLYFMIGLPGEEDADLDGILETARKVSVMRKECSPGAAQVRMSISFFIPKPHTLFERQAMGTKESLEAKAVYLRRICRGMSKLRLDFHKVETSILEAALSRGDRSLGKVILEAYKSGCVLDGWSEHFRFEKWLAAFERCGKPYQAYLGAKGQSGALAWEHIDLLS